MAIALRGVGSTARANSGNVSPGLPTGTAQNDILILLAASLDNVTHSVSGYTQIDSQKNNGSGFTISVWYKRAGSSESAPTVSHSAGNAIIAKIAGYSGVQAGATLPHANSVWNSGTSTTLTANQVTPSLDGAMIICAGGCDKDTSGKNVDRTFGTFSGSSPSMTEEWDVNTTATDPQIVLDDGLQTTAAATGNRTSSISIGAGSTPKWCGIQIAIANPAAITATPGVLSLTTTNYAPQIKLAVIPPVKNLTTTKYAPVIGWGIIPPTKSLTITSYAPDISIEAHSVTVTPDTLALILSSFAPRLNLGIVPDTKSLVLTGYAPSAQTPRTVTPDVVALLLNPFAPQVNLAVIPGTKSLALTGYAPSVQTPRTVTPGTVSLILTGFAPQANLTIIPGAASLVVTGLAPVVLTPRVVTPDAIALVLTEYPPRPNLEVRVPLASLALSTFGPQIGLAVVVPPLALSINGFAPQLKHVVSVPTASLSIIGYGPQANLAIAPGCSSLVMSGLPPFITILPVQIRGLRIYNHGVVELCLVLELNRAQGMGGAPIMVKNGVKYAAYLVELDDPFASHVRVKTSAGIKALRLYTG